MSNKPKGLGTKLVRFEKFQIQLALDQILGCKLYFTLKRKKNIKNSEVGKCDSKTQHFKGKQKVKIHSFYKDLNV